MSTLLDRCRAFFDDGIPLRAGDLDRMIAAIAKVDGKDVNFEAYCARTDRRGRRIDAADGYDLKYRTDAQRLDSLHNMHSHFVGGYFYAAKDASRARAYAKELGEPMRCDGGRLIRADGVTAADPDADDLSHRTARGANTAVADPAAMPDVGGLGLPEVKTIAMAIGAYSESIRPRLAAAVLARLRELGAGQVADNFAQAWGYGDLGKPSDDEDERAATSRARGDGHGLDDEQTAKAKLEAASTTAWQGSPRADTAPAASPSTGAELPSEAELMARQRSRMDAAPAAPARPRKRGKA